MVARVGIVGTYGTGWYLYEYKETGRHFEIDMEEVVWGTGHWARTRTRFLKLPWQIKLLPSPCQRVI